MEIAQSFRTGWPCVAPTYVVTEAGFGSDLVPINFLILSAARPVFVPNVGVIVATLRALKLHGGGGVAKAGCAVTMD